MNAENTASSPRTIGRERAVEGLLYTDFGRRVDPHAIMEGYQALLEGSARAVAIFPAAQPVRDWGWRITAAAAALLIGLGVLVSRQLGRLRLAPERSAGVAAAALPSVGRVVGDVQIFDPQGAPRNVLAGMHLEAGDRVRVGPDGSRLVLSYPDSTRLEVLQRSEVVLRPAGDFFFAHTAGAQSAILVSRGGLDATIAPVPGKSEVFATRHGEVLVVGTRFMITAMEDGSRVDMFEGEVEVRNTSSGERTRLTRNHYASLGKELQVTPRTMPPAGGAGRTRSGLVALYAFAEGRGTRITDSSGVQPPVDLQISEPAAVKWLARGGLGVYGRTAIKSVTDTDKIVTACERSGELTLEAWVRPATVDQYGAARIVALAGPGQNRNFMLGMESRYAAWGPSYVMRLRAENADRQGFPEFYSGPNAVTPTLTHLAFTLNRTGEYRFFVNGQNVGGAFTYGDQQTFYARPERPLGGAGNWATKFPLLLANSPEGRRQWRGEFQLVALYSRALSPVEVSGNYRAGARPAQRARP